RERLREFVRDWTLVHHLDGLTRQRFNLLNLVGHEQKTARSRLCGISCESGFASLAAQCYRANTDFTAESDAATGKIRHAAGVHLPAGKVPANDFPLRRFHQLPGEC